MEFLRANGVNEIFFCVDKRMTFDDLVTFVRFAKSRGMRVSWLSGDVSWFEPDCLGFDELYKRFIGYQRKAPADAKFEALHLDVEPHQNAKLTKERKWQLYADFVLRAAAHVHRDGEKIEWDIPFWLDDIRVAYRERTDAPLLEVVMDNSDGVTLMSYRDTAEAIIASGKTELEMSRTRNCRVIFGAETGKTSEGDFVSFYEEGKVVLTQELAKIRAKGIGVAIHHLGSWEQLK